MLNCKEVTEVCSAELDRPLRLGENVSLRTHLMMCTGCTEYRRQLRTLREVMQAYADGRGNADRSLD
jgi:predicted anti-sigma-YlaC factor YlaD